MLFLYVFLISCMILYYYLNINIKIFEYNNEYEFGNLRSDCIVYYNIFIFSK